MQSTQLQSDFKEEVVNLLNTSNYLSVSLVLVGIDSFLKSALAF